MPKTLTKSRLQANKHKPKIEQELKKKLNQIYPQICNHLNKN